MPGRSRHSHVLPAIACAAAAVPGIVALLATRRGGQRAPASVRVRGEGRVTAAPDIAVVGMGVEARHEAPAAAFSRSARLADELLAALRSAGVADADIRTSGVGLHPEYVSRPDGRSEIGGWRASHMLSVKLREINRVAAILERTVGILGSDGRIDSIQFRIEDTDALLMRARAAAFENAHAAAQRLATAADLRLGALVGVEDAAVASPLPRGMSPESTGMRMMKATLDAGGEVMPGQIDLTAQVVAEFALRRR